MREVNGGRDRQVVATWTCGIASGHSRGRVGAEVPEVVQWCGKKGEPCECGERSTGGAPCGGQEKLGSVH